MLRNQKILSMAVGRNCQNKKEVNVTKVKEERNYAFVRISDTSAYRFFLAHWGEESAKNDIFE